MFRPRLPVSRAVPNAPCSTNVRVSLICLGWEPPHLPEPEAETLLDEDGAQTPPGSPLAQTSSRPESSDLPELTPADREFFVLYYRLLQQEGREIEKQQAQLWQTPVAARVERGAAISDLIPQGEPVSTDQGEWRQTFRCLNTSELREGDEILLSDGNPVTGEVVTGTILSVSSDQVSVWTPELIARPALLDRYDTSIVHVRTLQNLLRWLQADERLRALVSGTLSPALYSAAGRTTPGF